LPQAVAQQAPAQAPRGENIIRNWEERNFVKWVKIYTC
ncbi:jg14137, partial [Pararge aegeria aegeria]